MKKKSVAD